MKCKYKLKDNFLDFPLIILLWMLGYPWYIYSAVTGCVPVAGV